MPPTYCDICGAWPARRTDRGWRCVACESRDWASEHPVPLPTGEKHLKDLASIGVPGAARKLSETQLKQRVEELETALNSIYHQTDCTEAQMAIINAAGCGNDNAERDEVEWWAARGVDVKATED